MKRGLVLLGILSSVFVLSQEKETEIKEVVMSGKKQYIEHKANKINVNVSDSPIASSSNAYDILLQSPGVIEQNGSLSFRSKSVTVLIDGKLSNLSGSELKDMLSTMSGNNIDKVEILPNPSAKYDAIGGSIINIKMKKNRKQGFDGSVGLNTGIGKHLNLYPNLSLNYKNNKWSVYGSYNNEISNQYYKTTTEQVYSLDRILYQNEYLNLKKKNHHYRVGLDYDVNEKNSLGVLFKGINNRYTSYANTDIRLENITSGIKNEGKTRIDNPAVNIYYKKILDESQRKLTFNADYFEYGKEVNQDYETNTGLNSNFLKNYSDGVNKVYSSSLDLEYPSAIGNFEIGAKAMFTKTDNDILWEKLDNGILVNDLTKSNRFIYKENIVSGYVSYDVALGSNWQLTLGMRGEQTHSESELIGGQTNRKNYFNLFPNLNIQYLKNPKHIFNLSYRKSIQRFGFEIVNPFVRYQSDYYYYQGNPNIRPQIDHSIGFTYTYNQNLILGISETHSVDALGPVYTKQGETTINTYTNFKNSDFFYVFASWNKKILKNWNTNLVGGTGFYKFNTETDDYKQQSNNSQWAYLLQSINHFTFKNNWVAEFNLVYQSDIAFGIFKQKGYLSSNIGVSKQFMNKKASVKLSISDVFNTIKIDREINYNGVLMNQNRKKESRFIMLGFNYKFGNGNVKIKKREVFQDMDSRMKVEQ